MEENEADISSESYKKFRLSNKLKGKSIISTFKETDKIVMVH